MRQKQSESDNPLLMAGAVVLVVVILVLVVKMSPAVIFKVELPWIISQAKIYSAVAPTLYNEEKAQLLELQSYLKEQQSAKKLKDLPAKNIRTYISEHSQMTDLTTKIITCLLIVPLSIFLIVITMKKRKRQRTVNENLGIVTGLGLGVNGFISIVSKYLSPQTIESIRNNPSPQQLKNAFISVREKVNIPNNLAGRQFRPFSAERIAILEVGKKKNYDLEGGKNESQPTDI